MPNEQLKDTLASLRLLSDDELVARVKTFAAHERGAMAQLVAHLAELDTRDIHLRAGYGSLFAYCRDAIGLSEHEAYNRIEAARAVRRFPVILAMLAGGSVNLTTVRLLAPHLTVGNHRDVLESAHRKRKAEVEEIVADLSPRPDVRPSLRRLPAPTVSPAPAAPSGQSEPIGGATPVALPVATLVPTDLAPLAPAPSASGPVATPLSPDRYKVQFTIGSETLEKLRLAKDLLRHAIPSGDDAAVLDRALTALLADLAKKKFAGTDQPRPSRGSTAGSRYIPAEVKRVVWLRDLGRCAFVGNDRRCHERGFLEFHHVRPYALGGKATVENVQLRCRRHNDYEARVYFGQDRANVGSRLMGETEDGVASSGTFRARTRCIGSTPVER